MEIQEILDELQDTEGNYPTAAIREAMKRPEDVTPGLLDILVHDAEHMEELDDEDWDLYSGHVHAMYLLAQFRETAAYPLVIRFLSKEDVDYDIIFGDVVTQDLSRILASVCDGDLSPLKSVIENTKIDEWVRVAAIAALTDLVVLGKASREDIIAYYGTLMAEKLPPEIEGTLWQEVGCCALDLYPEELEEQIRTALQRNYIRTMFHERELDEQLSLGKDIVLARLPRERRDGCITDTLKAQSWWARSQPENLVIEVPEEEPPRLEQESRDWSGLDIPRNEPCPCGSGKKYKKCCGRLGN